MQISLISSQTYLLSVTLCPTTRMSILSYCTISNVLTKRSVYLAQQMDKNLIQGGEYSLDK